MVDPGEQCDDGNADDTDQCPSTCDLAYCGDGFVQSGVEECDDGNDDETDDCIPVFCTGASCGDGFLQDGEEECDDGNLEDGDACPTTCEPAYCGDGFEWTDMEECDDGNGQSNDGCTPQCIAEFPPVCTQGNDPGTNAPWVVCSADDQEAWVSANTMGQYHPLKICEDLGYDTVGAWGGNCGSVCGYCQQGTSCQNNGNKVLPSQWNGSGNCGSDQLGPIICQTVSWTCINN
jgi:cysteine-rich repeat protein